VPLCCQARINHSCTDAKDYADFDCIENKNDSGFTAQGLRFPACEGTLLRHAKHTPSHTHDPHTQECKD